MKKLFLILCFAPLTIFSQIVYIPDNNFKAKLIGLGIDTNADEEIEVSEALAVTTLTLASANISDFTGIQAFTQVTFLLCSDNPATQIDLSALTMLNDLDCSFMMQLTGIDVGTLVNLEVLDISYNSFTHIDLTNAVSLRELEVTLTPLLELDTSTLVNLETVYCIGTSVSYLDFSNNPNLCRLYSENIPTLTRLNMKNGSIACFQDILLSMNPNLTNVCVDDGEGFFFSNYFVNNGMPGVNVNTYCSFTPGGSYNTITAHVSYDIDGNGCDAADTSLQSIKIQMSSDTAYSQYFTDSEGNATGFTQAGNYVVEPMLENPSWFTITPATDSFNFADIDSNLHNSNFCVTANGTHTDVEVAIFPLAPARPGYDAEYRIIFSNKGNQINSGTVTFDFPPGLLQLVSSTPAPLSQTSSQHTFAYDNLAPFASGEISITMHVQSPVDDPAVNNGDILSIAASITADGNDENPLDNSFQMQQVVVGSFDPNDKICAQGNQASPALIGDYLHYVVNFENTGTASAENIVVLDMIDISNFNVDSMQVISSSHPMQVRVTGTKAEFIFQNINLEPQEKGYVAFKIKTLATLTEGRSVSNKANIYFDFNAPVETNSATTIFQTLASQTFEGSDRILAYPNPAGNFVKINADSKISTVALMDLRGRILKIEAAVSTIYEMDLSGITSGIYLLRIKTEKGESLKKLIRN